MLICPVKSYIFPVFCVMGKSSRGNELLFLILFKGLLLFFLIFFSRIENDVRITTQKMKFSIMDFFSKCDQTRRKLRIWSHLLRKSLLEKFIFCAVCFIAKHQHIDPSFQAEVKFFMLLVLHNSFFNLSDHLSPLIRNEFKL